MAAMRTRPAARTSSMSTVASAVSGTASARIRRSGASSGSSNAHEARAGAAAKRRVATAADAASTSHRLARRRPVSVAQSSWSAAMAPNLSTAFSWPALPTMMAKLVTVVARK